MGLVAQVHEVSMSPSIVKVLPWPPMMASRFPTNTALTYTSSCVWKDAAGNYASLAYIPHRNGSFSFSADFPPIYNANEVIIPIDTVTGRQNERSLEGLTVSSDGKTLNHSCNLLLTKNVQSSNPTVHTSQAYFDGYYHCQLSSPASRIWCHVQLPQASFNIRLIICFALKRLKLQSLTTVGDPSISNQACNQLALHNIYQHFHEFKSRRHNKTMYTSNPYRH